MKKHLLLGLALLGLASANLRATAYVFEDFQTSLFDSEGLSWTSTLNLELGGFINGFTPTASNRSDWLTNWVSEPGGYYDPSGPEWAASLTLGDNSIFSPGSQLYLWAFDVQTEVTSQQALFFDASWMVVVNDALDPNVNFLSFSGQSSAVLGLLDPASQSAFTAASASGNAVPEPSTYGVLAGLGLLVVSALRKSAKKTSTKSL